MPAPAWMILGRPGIVSGDDFGTSGIVFARLFNNIRMYVIVFLMMNTIFYVDQCHEHDDANALFKFSYSQVTGDIAALAVCTQLTQLGLSSAQVTGDIAALAACTQLQVLDLDWTEVMAGNY